MTVSCHLPPLQCFSKRLDLIGLFPSEGIQILLPSEVSIGAGGAINRPQQVQVRDNLGRLEPKNTGYGLLYFFIGNMARAKSMDWIPAFAGMTEWMDIVCHSRPDRESSVFCCRLWPNSNPADI